MENPKHTKLPSLILTLYKNNIGLFLRIMLPVAIIAIILDISVYYRTVDDFKQYINSRKEVTDNHNTSSQTELRNPVRLKISPPVFLNTSGRGTLFPISQFTADMLQDLEPWSPGMSIREVNLFSNPPKVSWKLFPIPSISLRHQLIHTWNWSLNFRTYEYTPLILLIFTLCPLSLVVSRQYPGSRLYDQKPEISTHNARSVWKDIRSKAVKVLIITILFLVIVDISQNISTFLTFIYPKIVYIVPISILFYLILIPKIYVMITLSLYNQCTLFENRSIIDIFKRSYSLVRGVRLKYLSIYLLTAWVAAIVSSVLIGSTLFVLSFLLTELAPIRDALTPLRFLSLFIGGNVEVLLSDKLGFLPTISILIVKGIVAALLVPLWAVVTTHLYNERIGMTPEAIEA